MAGVDIVFDTSIDEGTWPGPLAGRDGAFGMLWLGPQGLLTFLETGLGLSGEWASAAERTLGLAALLESRHGFWRKSFEADAIATSERLLRDRDVLVLHGWAGESLSPRLNELWQATSGALPGNPDRLRSVWEQLGSREVDVTSMQLPQPCSSYSPGWRRVLEALEKKGVTFSEVAPPKAREISEKTLTLFRPHGQLAAAEQVAGSLAQLDSLEGVVVVGGDSMLDEALARHGLPRLGLAAALPASHALVGQVLETAWQPMDPQSLHALLCMDPGIVPRFVAGRLIRALSSMPGRSGPDWKDAIASVLDTTPDDQSRAKLAKRIDDLLMPVISLGESLESSQLKARLDALSTWARGRAIGDPSLASVVSHCQRVLDLADAHGGENFERSLVLEFGAKATEGRTGKRAELGIASVRQPAAVLGPARTVIWWDFTRQSAPRPGRLRLSPQEQSAMGAQGIEVPDFAAAMEAEAKLWQRPLAHAETLVLVCPEVDDAGETNYPHPLWDELSTSMRHNTGLAESLTSSQLVLPAAAKHERCTRAPLPQPQDEVRTTHSLPLREFESPSSLKALIGCSLKWALRYHGHVYSGIGQGPGEPSPLLYGTVAHYLLAEVFGGGALTGEVAADKADELVDRDLIQLCEALGLPRYHDEQGIVRRAIVESARRLGELMAECGASVGSVEEEVAGTFGDLQLKGRADMILRNPDVVIDLKWGAWSNRKSLESGTALQLAAYAHAAQEGDTLPTVGYFVLKDQVLLAEPDCPLPDAETPGTVSAEETWRLAMRSLERKQQELASGTLLAPGATVDEVESRASEDGLVMDPECRYCDLGAICGRYAAR